MPKIAPFSAIRYDSGKVGGELSSVLAPPYDVLDESDRQVLLARNPRNIVAIDLPHVPPKTLGPPEAYERSAARLREWITEGTLVRGTIPAIYVYYQRFRFENRAYTRRMLIARAWLTPFADGPILPHERTFGGPKEDRLALMRATGCQLSPVFGLFSDPARRMESLLASMGESPPDAAGRLDQVDNLLWAVEDRKTIEQAVALLLDAKVYIADGHHRYETALRYREETAKSLGGRLPPDHPANFIMLALAAMEDPGSLVLPYHRVMTHVDVRTLLQAWSAGAQPAPPEQADLVIQDGRSQDRASLRFTDRSKLAELEPGESPAWHQLDTAYLHRYLVDELLAGQPAERGTAVLYAKSNEDAVRLARQESGVALLLNPTPMSQLRAVSEAGGLMPQKSTYFHPKLTTGLTIYPLA